MKKVLVHHWMLSEIESALVTLENNVSPPLLEDSISLTIIRYLKNNNEGDFYINPKLLKRVQFSLNRANSKYECYKKDTCFRRIVAHAKYIMHCILTGEEFQTGHYN